MVFIFLFLDDMHVIYLQTIWDGYKVNDMDTDYLIEAVKKAYDYASDMNIMCDVEPAEDIEEDSELDDDIQMSFKL